ncbi:uncharacterized protein LOC103868810 [Brassica rapa]|uniref:uncharacterized protein LOC103868810 n=1 Tax=Brassica campestris TaxID=3711 RepID=UPI00142E2FA9|nr:uncharacterized protein LOC103868810 [Brassica rapa]
MSIEKMAMQRIEKEFKDVTSKDSLYIISRDSNDLFKWNAMIQGPYGSPYAGGMFSIDIKFLKNYPFSAPKHPIINSEGSICLDILKDNWDPPLTVEKDGDLYDQDGHLRNATCQKLDAQRNVIPDADATGAAQPVEEAAPPKALADYNHPDEYYTNRSAIRLPEIQKENFELKPQYYTLVSQLPYSGLPHEHPMDHLERFVDLIAAIRMDGVP